MADPQIHKLHASGDCHLREATIGTKTSVDPSGVMTGEKHAHA